jgi:hypothetical protein
MVARSTIKTTLNDLLEYQELPGDISVLTNTPLLEDVYMMVGMER